MSSGCGYPVGTVKIRYTNHAALVGGTYSVMVDDIMCGESWMSSEYYVLHRSFRQFPRCYGCLKAICKECRTRAKIGGRVRCFHKECFPEDCEEYIRKPKPKVKKEYIGPAIGDTVNICCSSGGFINCGSDNSISGGNNID